VLAFRVSFAVIGTLTLLHGQSTNASLKGRIGKAFNKAFATPPAGKQGNFGRNVLRGFNAVQADIGVQRQFALERAKLHFRAEFFNMLNHPNFGSPVGDLTSPLFGRSIQTLASFLGAGGSNGGFNPLYQVGGPRSIQLAMRLQF
jgi:hypothetical protein